MRRPVPAALAALLLVGAAVGALAAGEPTAMLAAGEPSSSDLATGSVDVSRAVDLQRRDAAARLDRYAFEERFASTDGTEARRELLLGEIVAIRGRIGALRSDGAELRRAYAAGSIDARRFVLGLARLDARADRLADRIDALRPYGAEVGISPQRWTALEARLVGLRGPVRDRALAAVRGDRPPIRLFVEASANGTALAMIEAGTHVREAYRADRRTVAAAGRMNTSTVVDLVTALYPSLYPDGDFDRGPRTSLWGGVGRGIWEIVLRPAGLRITAYADGDTEAVFHEVQERPLGSVPAWSGVTASANGTALVVNRSYPGGPLRVATYDNATGDPVPATVRVAGAAVETGSDGVAWTLAPGAIRFRVTAIRPGGNVTVRVRPLARVPLGGEG